MTGQLWHYMSGGPFGQFRNFQRKSRKMVFLAVWRIKTAEKRTFGKNTRSNCLSSTLRFEVNGVCPETFP